MSRHKVTIIFDVDDEELEQHIRHQGETITVPPYSEDVSDWDASDLLEASDASIIDFADADITDYSRVERGNEGG